MRTFKRFSQVLGMAISTLLLLALTVSPVAAGGKFP
jgi:hypothetical protein